MTKISHSRRIRRTTTGYIWDRHPRRLRMPALRRLVSRWTGRSRTRRSVVVFFCGSPLLVLLISSLLPTEASRAYPRLWMGTHPTLPSKPLQGGGETLSGRTQSCRVTAGWTICLSCSKYLPFARRLASNRTQTKVCGMIVRRRAKFIQRCTLPD